VVKKIGDRGTSERNLTALACARLPSLSADASAQASGGQAGSSAGRDDADRKRNAET
jgi:hypothetical protein